MLVTFKMRNFRSFNEEQVLSFEARVRKGQHDPGLRAPPGAPGPLSTVAAVYGPNASGKSNLLRALRVMCYLVAHPHDKNSLAAVHDPFRWGDTPDTSILLEATFILAGVRYCYGFTFDHTRIQREWLYAWPRGRRQMWFTREGDTFRTGSHLHAPRKHGLTPEVVSPTRLALRTTADYQHPQLQSLAEWFEQHHFIRVPPDSDPERIIQSRGALEAYVGTYLEVCDEHTSHNQTPERSAMLRMLQISDPSVLGIRHSFASQPDTLAPSGPQRHLIAISHRGGAETSALPLEEESRGTKTMAFLGPPVILALQRGTVLCIDEIDAGLHPLLTHRLIDLFQDPQVNRRNAQLLFTTHDSWLLTAGRTTPHVSGLGVRDSDRLLRRDQIWLTEKSDDLHSYLYPLTDIMPRAGEDLQRGYLEGRYGAIPFPAPLHVDLCDV